MFAGFEPLIKGAWTPENLGIHFFYSRERKRERDSPQENERVYSCSESLLPKNHLEKQSANNKRLNMFIDINFASKTI